MIGRVSRVTARLTAEAWARYFRGQLHQCPLPVLAAFANAVPLHARRTRRSWTAVDNAFAAAAHLPEGVTGPSVCLVRSLVALRLLGACREPARLVIGLRSSGAADRFRGHAWVDHPRNPEVPARYAAVIAVPPP